MNIVADQNIPLIKEFFSDCAEIKTLPGREIRRADLEHCDVLLVRSVTRVNGELLSGTPVQFVGSCTIGLDHVDTGFLDRQGIIWANAPGCNARGVVQYVFSVLAQLLPGWQGKSVGIVGCGNIGKELYKRFSSLGVKVSCYDPFVDDPNYSLVSFEEVLESDIVTCHTPLTYEGKYPTHHLIGQEAFACMKEGTLLINSCRGGVVDEAALLQAISGKNIKAAIDVWEDEPAVNFAVLDAVDIATPHIAGYTLEGRQNGTFMVYQAFCSHFGLAEKKPETVMSLDRVNSPDDLGTLDDFLLECYPILDDDKRIRDGKKPEYRDNFPDYFDRLRKHYPHRREYTHYQFPQAADRKGFWKQAVIIRG